MNSEETLGMEKLTMNPQNAEARGTRRSRAKGKARDKPAPAPVIDVDAPRYPLRSLAKPTSTVEPTYTHYAFAFPDAPLYTPLNIAPLGTPAGTPAERYLPPHLRSLPLRPACPIDPNTATPTRIASTSSAQSSKSIPPLGPAKAPITPTGPKLTKEATLKTRSPPSPTPGYLSQASRQPTRLHEPAKLLVILDLNGTLIHRKRSSVHSFTQRPYLSPFLEYCFREHSVMVWSSAQPENVAAMCHYLFTREQRKKLVAEWDRTTLDLTKAQYREKVQVYKRLSKVWGDEALQRSSCPGYFEGRRWSQANTILVDDGQEKARAEPWNLVEVPEFTGLKGGKDERGEVDNLAEVLCWMEEARRWSDVSAFAGAMGLRFEVGKDWSNLANEWSQIGRTDQATRLGVESQTREVYDCEEESDAGDSDSEGGVKLPLNYRSLGRRQ